MEYFRKGDIGVAIRVLHNSNSNYVEQHGNKEGDICEAVSDSTLFCYEDKILRRSKDRFRLATPKEIEYYKRGIRNINYMPILESGQKIKIEWLKTLTKLRNI